MKHNDPLLLRAVETAAAVCGAPVDLVMSKRRTQTASDARALVIRYLMDQCEVPIRDMRKLFSPNHTTIYMARDRARESTVLRQLYDAMTAKLGVNKTTEPEPALPPRPVANQGFGNLWG